jgi:hypothetical protein
MDIDGDGRDRQGRSQGCATKLGEVKICVPFTDFPIIKSMSAQPAGNTHDAI